jgi:hypothetical protein
MGDDGPEALQRPASKPAAWFGCRPAPKNTSSWRSAAADVRSQDSSSMPIARRGARRLRARRRAPRLVDRQLVEVGVAVDHCGFGNSGGGFSTRVFPGREPNAAPSSDRSSSPSAASSLAAVSAGRVQEHGQDAQALDERAQRLVERAGLLGSLASCHGARSST